MRVGVPTVKLGDAGLSTNASHALHSMLGIVGDRSVAAWQLCEPAEADVLFVGGDMPAAALHTLPRAGQLLVAVIGAEAELPPASAFVLRHPFRVMQLLDLLDRVAAHLHANTGTPAPSAATPWASIDALRKATAQARAGEWLSARVGNDARIWLDADGVRTDADTLLRLGAAPLEIGAFAAAAEPPPAGSRHCTLADFCWHVGMHAPAMPPWLDGQRRYTLRRWPDLGRLGASETLLDLCADLIAHPRTPSELLQRPGLDAALAGRFLAAASLAGWLVEYEPIRQRSATAGAQLRAGWGRLLNQLRRRLA